MSLDPETAALHMLSSTERFMKKIQDRHDTEEYKGTTMAAIKRQVSEAKHCDDLLAISKKQAALREAEAFYIDTAMDYMNNGLSFCQLITGIDIKREFVSMINKIFDQADCAEISFTDLTPVSTRQEVSNPVWPQTSQVMTRLVPLEFDRNDSTLDDPLIMLDLFVSPPAEIPSATEESQPTTDFDVVYNGGNPTRVILERDGVFYILSCEEHNLKFDDAVDTIPTSKGSHGRIWMRASSHRRYHHSETQSTTQQLFGVIVLNCTDKLQKKNNEAFRHFTNRGLGISRDTQGWIVGGSGSNPMSPEENGGMVKRKRKRNQQKKRGRIEMLPSKVEDDSDDYVGHFSKRRSPMARRRATFLATVDSDSEPEMRSLNRRRKRLEYEEGVGDSTDGRSTSDMGNPAVLVSDSSSDKSDAYSSDRRCSLIVKLRVDPSKLMRLYAR
ncbi:hypothetical protein VHEMI07455 [[Torrubiella] hemipterigena]|uniref:Uncharacterized protein n=1 Tax=[Torrubiella] hemipterigena TaxID=1531966 RepID=A0A0A1TLR1_9HYPO|nr:hypothetical protein VHEMI07455 [[Torrubiella] hemipterigena]